MGRTNYSPSRSGFVVDPASIARLSGRQIDWTLVGEDRRQTPGQIVVVSAAGAAGGAVSIPVVALARALPSGTVLDFGGLKYARTTAAAAAGATAVTVAAIPTALVNLDQAVVAGSGAKFLPAGTVIGTLLGNGKASPRIVTTNPAIGMLETNATDDVKSSDSVTGYGVIVGGVIFENLLPEATGGPPKVLATAVKTELASAGAGFVFQQYSDSRT
jgi:hypothetical protein